MLFSIAKVQHKDNIQKSYVVKFFVNNHNSFIYNKLFFCKIFLQNFKSEEQNADTPDWLMFFRLTE